ncbi:MAG: hypothetical protein AAFY29_20585 [Pseudomonadota bacterium]
MENEFDKLMALHDEELSADDARETEEFAKNPEAQALLQGLKQADDLFRSAADDLLEQPVPPEMISAIHDTEPRSATIIPFPGRRSVIGLALAAGIAAIAVTGLQLQGPESIQDEGAASYARLLQSTLESAPSGDLRSEENGEYMITPRVSFATTDRGYCREYMSYQQGIERTGLACRSDSGRWSILDEQVMSSAASEQYRAAGGESQQSPAARVLDGAERLGFDEEQNAIRSAWK